MGRRNKRPRQKGRHKRWSMKSVNSGSGPNREVLSQYRSHANSMGRIIPSNNPDHPLPYVKHRLEQPRTIGATKPMRERTAHWHEEMAELRTPFHEKLIEWWQSERRQGIAKFHEIVIIPQRLFLFFSGADFVFIEERTMFWRRSMTYDHRARTMRPSQILWVEKVEKKT